MTTPAMPEPTQEQLDAFINRAGFSYGWMNLESSARRMAERAVWEIEAAKLATLQAQPAGSAKLLDGCKSIIDGIAVSSAVLKQAQPAAEVSDEAARLAEQLSNIANGVRICGVHDRHFVSNRLHEIARAILALRPQAVPMTDGAKRELISDFFSDDWAQERAMNLLHDYDQHHGITAQGAQEGK